MTKANFQQFKPAESVIALFSFTVPAVCGRVHYFKFWTNASRSYSVSYCCESHNSSTAPRTDSALRPVADVVAVDDVFPPGRPADNENRSSSWSVAIDARLRLSAFTTVFAMLTLNFCSLQQAHSNTAIIAYYNIYAELHIKGKVRNV